MKAVIIISQIIVAVGIFNVWIFRYGQSTNWRGGMAKNMREEFWVYGLPVSFMRVIGFIKLLLAGLMIVGIWFPAVTKPAAVGMAILMLGAVGMHFKVRDPLKKSLPAFTLFVLSLIITVF